MKVLALLSVLYLSANALPFIEEVAKSTKEAAGVTWVVLVAGSDTWSNYRHQADVYHAYQLVKAHGIPDKNIIVFHTDDIANNAENPHKGQIINQPGGSDVYHGVPKDYIGKDVTPENFMAVLKGSAELENAGKKVLKSGPNDHVFINFVDHGAPNLIAFPKKYLYAKDLHATLDYMRENKKFNKLVFYLEACESGSMFANYLTSDMNIYATTAANPTESSYATYFDENLGTYLGDLYSVNWMEDSDMKDLAKETLHQQFEIVKQKTTKSHVIEYGDTKTTSALPLSQFQGATKKLSMQTYNEQGKYRDAVDSGDVPVHILKNKIRKAVNEEKKQKLTEQLDQLLTVRQTLVNHLQKYVESIAQLVGNEVSDIMNTKQVLNHEDCYRQFVDTFHDKCYNLNQNPYALRKLYVFVNVCEGLHANNAQTSITEAVALLNNYCLNNLGNGYPILVQ